MLGTLWAITVDIHNSKHLMTSKFAALVNVALSLEWLSNLPSTLYMTGSLGKTLISVFIRQFMFMLENYTYHNAQQLYKCLPPHTYDRLLFVWSS